MEKKIISLLHPWMSVLNLVNVSKKNFSTFLIEKKNLKEIDFEKKIILQVNFEDFFRLLIFFCSPLPM